MNIIRFPRPPLTLYAVLLIMSMASLFSEAALAQPAASTPLTYNQILGLLKDGVPCASVVEQVERHKVDFTLDTDRIFELSENGGCRELVQAIRVNLFQPLMISSPQNGTDCRQVTRVMGRGVPQTGKHLWLFAHKAGLVVWWPQGGEVRINSEGMWMQNVTLGNEHDAGFDFEIQALWVTPQIHRDLMNYLLKGEQEGSFPGMALPNGSPAIQITCTRTS